MTLEKQLIELSKRPQLSREEKQLLFDTVCSLLRLERLERAGQAMRDGIHYVEHCPTQIQFGFYKGALIDGAKAWDAATTKGDDK